MVQIMAKLSTKKKTVPETQRYDPSAPGDGRALGQTFVEETRHVFTPGDHPARDVLVVEEIPVVLGRGIVSRAQKTGNYELCKAHARDTAGHYQHDVDRDQLGPVQSQRSAEEGDQTAGENHKEEKKQRGRSAEV